VTFKDSNWLMSIVLAHQPISSISRPTCRCSGLCVVPRPVGNSLRANGRLQRSGNPTGALRHLRSLESVKTATAFRADALYHSMFMPACKVIALAGAARFEEFRVYRQFVEIRGHCFHREYSVRAAQMAFMIVANQP